MPKANQIQAQDATLQSLANRSATAFAAAVLCVYPLYIDHFSNLGITKYTGVATLMLAFSLWLGALALVGAKPYPGRLKGQYHTMWALGAFVAANLVSTVASLSPVSSLWGLGGYYGGLSLVVLTALAYLCVRAFALPKLPDGLMLATGVTTILVTILYVLNIFNIDPIGAYENTAVIERAQFFSTLGQKNFNAGYFCIALPLAFYAFITAVGAKRTLLYGIPAFFGGLTLAVVDAEGLLLGLLAAGLVLVCQKQFDTRWLRRMAVIGMSFFAWAGWMQYMREHVYTQGGTPMLAALGKVAVAGFGICFAVWAALAVLRRLLGRELSLWLPGRIVTAVLVVGAAVVVILANCWAGFPSLGERLDGVLIFNDDWGTYRGTAWRIAWGSWADGSLWRKLVGVGPGMMHDAVAAWAGADITPRMATFYAAHNEFLEQLLTTGLLGLAAWVWFIGSHLRRAAHNWNRPGVAAVGLALISYLAQSLVSIRVSMIFPEVMILFAFLAAFCADAEAEQAVSAAPAALPADKGEKGKKGKKSKKQRGTASTAEPAPQPSAARRALMWFAILAAAVLAMAVCGGFSKLLFGFLY